MSHERRNHRLREDTRVLEVLGDSHRASIDHPAGRDAVRVAGRSLPLTQKMPVDLCERRAVILHRTNVFDKDLLDSGDSLSGRSR